jgi:sortase A
MTSLKRGMAEVLLALAIAALLLPADQHALSNSPLESATTPEQWLESVKKQRMRQQGGIIPVSIQIPAVRLSAEIEQVGILPNGAMDVPKNDRKVGWMSVGYRPGQKGNAVMAGHVDNLRGPAVFHPLHQVKVKDEVLVRDRDGKLLTFIVTEIGTYKAEQSPVVRIFAPSTKARLNLITCTGFFDPVLRSHVDRLVVYTELKESDTVRVD